MVSIMNEEGLFEVTETANLFLSWNPGCFIVGGGGQYKKKEKVNIQFVNITLYSVGCSKPNQIWRNGQR